MTTTWADGRRPWTDEEFGFIQHPPRGWAVQDVADYLGRSVNVVRRYRRKISEGWARQRDALTEEELAFIAVNLDRFAADVGRDLGRSKASVQNARHKLRRVGLAGFATTPHKRPQPHEVGLRTLLAKTCPRCGLLWGGGEFQPMARGFHPLCRACRSAERRAATAAPARAGYRQAYVAAMEEVTRSLATQTKPYRASSGEPWTERDLASLGDRTLTTPEVAAKLGRTWQAVHAACKRYDVRRPREVATRLPTGRWQIEFAGATRDAA